MVAPLIVGAARVVGTKTKATRVAPRALGGSQARAEAYDKLREDGYIGRSTDRYTEKGKQALAEKRKGYRGRKSTIAQNDTQETAKNTKSILSSSNLKKIDNVTNKLHKTIKAGTTSATIFWTAIPFYIPQLSFWLIGIAGIGLESDTVTSYLIPGNTLFIVSYLIIALIGVCTMAYAVFSFTLRGVNSFGGVKGLIFVACLAGYLVVFINFFPWFIVWLVSVAYLQKED